MIEHVLKTHVAPFNAVWARRKLFEFRRNDRGFAVGDTLSLLEYDHDSGKFTGRTINASVSYILRGPEFGVPDGFCVISLDLISGHDHGGLAWSFIDLKEPTHEQ